MRAPWRSERGAELIELAVALPLLLLVAMGIVDFGFLFQRYLVLTNAAMEGARVAVLPGYSIADAQARASTYAQASGVPAPVTAVASPLGSSVNSTMLWASKGLTKSSLIATREGGADAAISMLPWPTSLLPSQA